MWPPPQDPQIFGALEVDAGPIVEFIERARTLGHRVTPTHVVGRAVGYALQCVPELNVRIGRGRARRRSSVDIFFITSVAKGRDLSGVKVADVPNKPAIVVATELYERSTALKRGDDREFSRTKRIMDALPASLLRGALRASAYLTEELALDVPALALRREPFGSAMVTSVGMFGLPQGFAPLSWMYDVPLLVLVGELGERAVVSDGRVVAGQVLPLTMTIDHRYVDGWQISQGLKALRQYLAAPQSFEPVLALSA